MASPARDNSHNHLAITADYIYIMIMINYFRWLAYALVRHPVTRQTRTSALHSSWNSLKQALMISYPRKRVSSISSNPPRIRVWINKGLRPPASAGMTNAIYCLINVISKCLVRSCPQGCGLTNISSQVTLRYDLTEHESITADYIYNMIRIYF